VNWDVLEFWTFLHVIDLSSVLAVFVIPHLHFRPDYFRYPQRVVCVSFLAGFKLTRVSCALTLHAVLLALEDLAPMLRSHLSALRLRNAVSSALLPRFGALMMRSISNPAFRKLMVMPPSFVTAFALHRPHPTRRYCSLRAGALATGTRIHSYVYAYDVLLVSQMA